MDEDIVGGKDPSATSTMNEVMRSERALEGRASILREAKQSNPETFERAEARLVANPEAAQDLVDGLNNGAVNSMSEVDEAVLLHEKVRLRNARHRSAERAADTTISPQEKADALKRWEELEEQINKIDRATFRSGQIWGRMGQFRQRLMDADWGFVEMERRTRAAKGRPLTKAESDEVKAPLDGLPNVRTHGWNLVRRDSQSPLLTAPGPVRTAMGRS